MRRCKSPAFLDALDNVMYSAFVENIVTVASFLHPNDTDAFVSKSILILVM